MYSEIARQMANKLSLYYRFENDERWKDNKRLCPFYSEFYGMKLTLLYMGNVSFDLTYEDESPYRIKSVIVNGNEAMVKYIEGE